MTVSSTALHPKQVAAAIGALLDLRRPGFIWGPPGIGKSELVQGVADDRGIGLRDVRLGTMDATDIKGFPVPSVAENLMKWLPPDFLPPMTIEQEVTVYRDKAGVELSYDPDRDNAFEYENGQAYKSKVKPTETVELRTVPNDSQGILFLDELNQAPPMVQAAAYQLLLNRKVGNYTLPDGWGILAAGNRESDRANAQRMPSALALRLVHIDMETSVDDWCDWAIQHPDDVKVETLAFIRFKSNLLHAFDPKRRSSPSPRGWVFVSQLTDSGLPKEVELALMQGTVGEAEAAEYMAYLGMWKDLPTVDQVKLDPDGTPIPTNISALFGITSALARANTKDVYPRLKKYIDRMDAEWQVVFHKDALAYDKAFCATREWQQFAVKHSHLLA